MHKVSVIFGGVLKYWEPQVNITGVDYLCVGFNIRAVVIWNWKLVSSIKLLTVFVVVVYYDCDCGRVYRGDFKFETHRVFPVLISSLWKDTLLSLFYNLTSSCNPSRPSIWFY